VDSTVEAASRRAHKKVTEQESECSRLQINEKWVCLQTLTDIAVVQYLIFRF